MTPEDLAAAFDEGLLVALYRLASVRPAEVLAAARARGIPADELSSLLTAPTAHLDPLALAWIEQAKRSAAFGGAATGLGGWAGLPAGLLHALATLVRLAQRLSLTYGFDPSTDRGEIELWKSLAAATGARVRWEGAEADLVRRLPAVVSGAGALRNPLLLKAVQGVALRVLATQGLRATRWLPVLGGGAGFAIQWIETGRVGRALHAHWRRQHGVYGFDVRSAVEVRVISTSG